VEPEVVFRAEGLAKVYQVGEVEVHALRAVDLELARGELTGLAEGEVVVLHPSDRLRDGARVAPRR